MFNKFPFIFALQASGRLPPLGCSCLKMKWVLTELLDSSKYYLTLIAVHPLTQLVRVHCESANTLK